METKTHKVFSVVLSPLKAIWLVFFDLGYKQGSLIEYFFLFIFCYPWSYWTVIGLKERQMLYSNYIIIIEDFAKQWSVILNYFAVIPKVVGHITSQSGVSGC